MAQDYNNTVNLPATEFPMRAGLVKREPEMLKTWYDERVYETLMEKNEGKPLFVLHDGPPFSNGYIHMGTALNKCLKDFILRYRNMSGKKAPYVPGWDNHGMPIESAIIKKNKLDRKSMSIPEFRDACHAFAREYVEIQKEQFIRLGVLGRWDKPYLTMDPLFESDEVRVFGAMYEKGYIYKGKKPVYWCPVDETALAEAEIEYADEPCDSIYVKFPVNDDLGKLGDIVDLEKTFFLIWTTTPWTLPGNLAISLNPSYQYALMKTGSGETYIVAEELVESVKKAANLDGCEIVGKFKGRELEGMKAKHPFYDRVSHIIVGDHVTLDAGTGCVHTAPGHGMEDYEVCRKYPEIGILMPVNDRGVMTEEAGKFAGMHYSKANPAIVDELESSGMLLAKQTLTHSYPHCWRCKNPVIYRATDQWFCSVDAIKDQAEKACEDIQWMPEWGKERMIAMIRERSDWCISRQRHWGLPIPVFYCKDCGRPVCTPKSIEAVARLFEEKGSNVWYQAEPSEILPEGFACPHCGHIEFEKETDTLDGWFDSGSTHIASLEKDDPAQWPADLYLEGADQFRGWFQSSLLTAMTARGQAPYKAVLTHGWTVDGEGKAMHKSLGNAVAPEEMVNKYGADMLRLWVASADYRVDMRVSDGIFKQLSGDYLKIRNTARFLLGNLDGYDPDHPVPYEDLIVLDQWALMRLDKLLEKVRAGYEAYQFHTVYHAIHQFCIVDMSSYYLDIIKDRLYCEEKDSFARRSAQTAMYQILDTMVRMVAPILAFTSDEIWQFMPHDKSADPRHVLYNEIPMPNPKYRFSKEQEEEWETLHLLRDDVNKALEEARNAKLVGKSLDAEVTLYFTPEGFERFQIIKDQHFTADFIVSKVNILEGDGEGYRGENFPGVTISIAPAKDEKCDRCWIHDDEIGQDQEHPSLCPRCARVVKSMQNS